MNQINPSVRSMTLDEQIEYGLCNRGLMMEQGDRVYRLSAGTTDSIQVYQQGTILYVLTINHHLDYIALDWYQGSNDEPVDSIFLQGHTIAEFIGNDWHTLSLTQLATRLIQLFS